MMHRLLPRSVYVWLVARRDAAIGIQTLDHLVPMLLGPRPAAADPENNLLDRERVAAFANAAVVDELRSDIDRARAAYDQERSALVAGALLLFFLTVEAIASVRLLTSSGMATATATILGLALAMGTFALAAVVVKRPASRGRYYLVVTVAVLLVAALSVLRFDEVDAGDQGSLLGEAASALILVVVTIAPALLAEWALTRFHRRVAVAKDLRRARQHEAHERAKADRARRDIGQQLTAITTWDDGDARIRAEYLATFAAASASARSITTPARPSAPLTNQKEE